jgi:transketolase
MGSCAAEILAQHEPVPVEFVGVHDRFGQSGTPKELLDEYEMGMASIVAAVKRVVARKR